ncbi:hypothetical protein B0T21DRAFT_402075 [Apiosordaria backusii]|uniref:Uncharacterized protein n=1 Tax=Apiosordaria backusii TaxID=314023 RepID=A0AA40BM64_9PEZI|nr:hypothetical protein B0T21DRAFT_402075 [Apiosordaria backusii]
MLPSSAFLASILAFSSPAYSVPTSLDSSAKTPGIEGYTTVPIFWDLPIKADDPNGPTATVNGTIQAAIAKMEADYHGWNATFQAQLRRRPPPPHASSISADQYPEFTDCDIDYDKAIGFAIVWGIEYLRGVPGTAKNGPGPGNCGRVSCSWKSAIWWCNEDNNEKELQWGQIADGAYYVFNKCETDTGYVKGKGYFVKDKFNVFVVYDQSDHC